MNRCPTDLPAARQTRAPVDPWQGSSHDLVQRFIDVLIVQRRYSLYTCADYRADLRRLDGWLQRSEACTLASAGDQHLIRYLSDWVRRRGSTRKLSRVLLSLRRFYEFLCESHVRADNPMLSPSIRRWDEQQRPLTARIRQQRESSRAVAERDRVMLALMISGGLQASQVIALRLSDLHLEQGFMLVRDQPKPRKVLLSAELVEGLMQFLLEPRTTLLRGRDGSHVFPACGGREMRASEFWHAFRRRADGFRTSGRLPDAPRSRATTAAHVSSQLSSPVTA